MCVPRMSELGTWETVRHLNKDYLHKPLQKIFALYMEFYISVVRLLETSFGKSDPLSALHVAANSVRLQRRANLLRKTRSSGD